MTQEDKELLFKDLSARLPYNVLVHIYDIDICNYDNYLYEDYLSKFRINFIRIKPYLRTMSSMTDEEKEEFELLANRCITTSVGFVHFEAQALINWLDKKMFDHRGLIPKGLALVAPEEMYKSEELMEKCGQEKN